MIVVFIIIIVTNVNLVTIHPQSTDCLQLRCIKVDKSLGHTQGNYFNHIAALAL